MSRFRSRRARLLLALPAVLALLLLGGFLLLPRWLVAEPQLQEADLIFHLSIDSHSNADPFIASLYRPGRTRKIICVSGQISWQEYPADYVARHLIELGVPAQAVTAMHMPPDIECGAEGLCVLAKRAREEGARSALLIAQPEDSRHLAPLARRVFGREGLEVFVGYAPADRDELLRDWWRVHWKIQRLIDQSMQISLDQLYSNCR